MLRVTPSLVNPYQSTPNIHRSFGPFGDSLPCGASRDANITSCCKMARPERFELPTTKFVAWYSIQLSYGRVF